MSKGLKIAFTVVGALVVVGGLLMTGFVVGRSSNWFQARFEAQGLQPGFDPQPGSRMAWDTMRPDMMGRWTGLSHAKPGMMGKNSAGQFNCPYQDGPQFRYKMHSGIPYQENRADERNWQCPFGSPGKQPEAPPIAPNEN